MTRPHYLTVRPGLSLWLLLPLAVASLRAEDAPAPPPHPGHAQHEARPGAGGAPAAAPVQPKAADFLRLDPDAPKTVQLTLISAFNDANYGMNFDGHAKGSAKLVVPKDWHVKVSFRNQSPVPHSAIVVERPTVKKLQMGPPVFKGASTPDPVRGTTGPEVKFEFVADEAGDYAIACGFPAHAANGHWIAFEVSDTATAPSLKFGDAEAHTPK